jgi:hypothetical protein
VDVTVPRKIDPLEGRKAFLTATMTAAEGTVLSELTA